MPVPKMWRSRSVLMKLAVPVMILAVLIHAFIVIARHWAWTPGGVAFGLWAVVLGEVSVPEGLVPLIYVTFTVLSLLLILGCTTINLMFLHSKFMVVMPALITFSFISGMMIMVVAILWCLPLSSNGYIMGWTFYIAIVATCLDLATTTLSVAEFVTRWRQPQPHFRGHEGLVSQLPTEDPDHGDIQMEELHEL